MGALGRSGMGWDVTGRGVFVEGEPALVVVELRSGVAFFRLQTRRRFPRLLAQLRLAGGPCVVNGGGGGIGIEWEVGSGGSGK